MKTRFINCFCCASLLSLFPGLVSYGQQQDKHDEQHYVHPLISGVGTQEITYHLTQKLAPEKISELKNYLEGFHAIEKAQVEGLDIKIRFKEVTTYEMIHMYIQRMEIFFIHKNERVTN